MSRVIYTTERRPYPIAGVEYRNPLYFEKPHGNPVSVEVRGDFPHIVAAYGDKAALPEPEPLDLTPEGVARLPKRDVVELLEAHGVTEPKGKVDDLRAKLAQVMFMGEL